MQEKSGKSGYKAGCRIEGVQNGHELFMRCNIKHEADAVLVLCVLTFSVTSLDVAGQITSIHLLNPSILLFSGKPTRTQYVMMDSSNGAIDTPVQQCQESNNRRFVRLSERAVPRSLNLVSAAGEHSAEAASEAQQQQQQSVNVNDSPAASGSTTSSQTRSFSGQNSSYYDPEGWDLYDDVSTLSNCSTTLALEENIDVRCTSAHDRRMGEIAQFISPPRLPEEQLFTEDIQPCSHTLTCTPTSGGRWSWMESQKGNGQEEQSPSPNSPHQRSSTRDAAGTAYDDEDNEGTNMLDDISTPSNCSSFEALDENLQLYCSDAHQQRMAEIAQSSTLPPEELRELDLYSDEMKHFDPTLPRTPPSGGRWDWMNSKKEKK